MGLYEAHSKGVWYNLGFVIGALVSFKGGNEAASHDWKKRGKAGIVVEEG